MKRAGSEPSVCVKKENPGSLMSHVLHQKQLSKLKLTPLSPLLHCLHLACVFLEGVLVGQMLSMCRANAGHNTEAAVPNHFLLNPWKTSETRPMFPKSVHPSISVFVFRFKTSLTVWVMKEMYVCICECLMLFWNPNCVLYVPQKCSFCICSLQQAL